MREVELLLQFVRLRCFSGYCFHLSLALDRCLSSVFSANACRCRNAFLSCLIFLEVGGFVSGATDCDAINASMSEASHRHFPPISEIGIGKFLCPRRLSWSQRRRVGIDILNKEATSPINKILGVDSIEVSLPNPDQVKCVCGLILA